MDSCLFFSTTVAKCLVEQCQLNSDVQRWNVLCLQSLHILMKHYAHYIANLMILLEFQAMIVC